MVGETAARIKKTGTAHHRSGKHKTDVRGARQDGSRAAGDRRGRRRRFKLDNLHPISVLGAAIFLERPESHIVVRIHRDARVVAPTVSSVLEAFVVGAGTGHEDQRRLHCAGGIAGQAAGNGDFRMLVGTRHGATEHRVALAGDGDARDEVVGRIGRGRIEDGTRLVHDRRGGHILQLVPPRAVTPAGGIRDASRIHLDIVYRPEPAVVHVGAKQPVVHVIQRVGAAQAGDSTQRAGGGGDVHRNVSRDGRLAARVGNAPHREAAGRTRILANEVAFRRGGIVVVNTLRGVWTRYCGGSHLSESRDRQRARQEIRLVHHETGGSQPTGASRVEYVHADIERICIHAERVVVRKPSRITIGRGAHHIVLESVESETAGRGHLRPGAHGEEYVVGDVDRDHGDKPPF